MLHVFKDNVLLQATNDECWEWENWFSPGMSPQLVFQHQDIGPEIIYTQVTLKRSGRLCLCICSYTRVCKNNKRKIGMNLREKKGKSGHGKIWRGKREGTSDGIIF